MQNPTLVANLAPQILYYTFNPKSLPHLGGYCASTTVACGLRPATVKES